MDGAPPQYSIRLSDRQEFGPANLDLITEWAIQGRVPRDALLVPCDGSEVRSVMWVPELKRVLQAPPTVAGAIAPPSPPASSSGLIPAGNPPALIGYYLAVVALIMPPLILASVPLGIAGLIRVRKHPESKGTVHAWIAISSLVLVPGFWFLILLFLSLMDL